MSRQILSFDIRNHHIAAVLLSTGLKSSTIVDCGRVSIDPIKEAEQEPDSNPILQALRTLTKEINATSANIVVSLPMDQVIFRALTVPFKEESKIRQILPFELEPILPINVDDLTIDFQKITAGDHSKVFAVAMDNALLQNYLECFTELNLHPQLIVPGGFPLATQISGLDVKVPGHTVILNVDKTKSTLFALTSGHITLVRTLPSDITTEQGADSLALKVRQTLTALGESDFDGFSPTALYVSGPGLAHEESIPRLSQALDLPVGTIDFRRLLTNVDMDKHLQWDPYQYNDALSLAYLDAEGGHCPNFHHVRSTLRNYWTSYRQYIMGPAVLLCIALLLGLAGVLVESYYLNKHVEMQKSQLAQVFTSTFPDSRLTAPPLDQMKSKLKELHKETLGSPQTGANMRTIDILLEMSQRVPKSVEVVFNRMTMGGNSVTVSGETSDFNTVDEVKNSIEKSSYFKQVTIASANMDKSGKKVRFKLKMDL